MIYPVGSIIQPLNNWGQISSGHGQNRVTIGQCPLVFRFICLFVLHSVNCRLRNQSFYNHASLVPPSIVILFLPMRSITSLEMAGGDWRNPDRVTGIVNHDNFWESKIPRIELTKGCSFIAFVLHSQRKDVFIA